MAKVSWIGGDGNWTAGADWDTGIPPGAGDDAVLDTSTSYTVSLTTPITVNSITISDPSATLAIAAPGATETVTGNITNSANLLEVDFTGSGGTTLTVGGTLTNNTLFEMGFGSSAGSTVNVAGFSNTGQFYIAGTNMSGSNFQSTLNVAAAAPAAWTGKGQLVGDALLEFASGSGITSIAGGAQLLIGQFNVGGSGQNARVALASDTSSNSALATLSSNAGDFELADAAVVATKSGVDFNNTGTLAVSDRGSLTISGTLINSGLVTLGSVNFAPPTMTAAGLSNTGRIILGGGVLPNHTSQATLNITAAAPTTWTGSAFVQDDALLEFASGSISAIGSGATLQLDGAFGGPLARVANATDPTKSSALTQLASNAGDFELRNGNKVTTNAGVDFTNSGTLALDQSSGAGSSLTIGGTLTNTSSGTITIGNATLGAATTITAAGLSNAGTISLTGNSGNNSGNTVIFPAKFTVNGAASNSSTITVGEFSDLFVTGAVSGAGTISVGGTGSVAEFGAAVAGGQTVSFTAASGTVALDAPSQFSGTIAGLNVGSSTTTPTNDIDLTAIANGNITGASLDTTTDVLTVTTSTGTPLSLQLSGSYAAGTVVDRITDGAGTGTDLFLSSAVCFCRGTLILTEKGEVPVEELAAGDRVRTLSDGLKPIVWIGFGRSLVTRANKLARPVIVRRGALADNVPARDLYLTHGHALYLEGVLIPVENLVNHHSILWDDAARVVEYYHIELEDHDVLLANGAAAESYYDARNRAQFHNTQPGSVVGEAKPTFAPVLNGGPVVERAWTTLFERSGGRITRDTTEDPDLHLVANCRRVEPMSSIDSGSYRFALAGPLAGGLLLCSRSGVPSLAGVTAHDHRQLGVALARIVISEPGITTVIEPGAPLLLAGGCHPAESGYCWTDGELGLPPDLFSHLSGPFTIAVEIERPGMRYPLRAALADAA